MNRQTIVILLTGFILTASAQTLKRLGGIGALFRPVNDSIAKAHGLTEKKGLLVTKIHGETAAELKVKPGDILLSINGQTVNNTTKIYSSPLFTKYEGDETSWVIWRGKKEVMLKGKMLPKPKEKSEEFSIIYDQFTFRGEQLRCLISKPHAGGKKPAILSIQGYPCNSIDYLPAWHPSKQLADELTRRGYIVMRAEKPGMGDSRGSLNCYEIDFPTEADAFKAAFKKLKSLPDVDTSNIFIFGHSMGGMEAPFIANEVHPKGVIVYGVVTKLWYEYLMDMLRYQNPHLGVDPIQVEKEMRHYHSILYDMFINNKNPSEIIADHPEYRKLFERDFEYNGSDRLFTRSMAFSRSLNAVNPVEEWSKVDCYVLSAHGEYDIQVLDDFGHREIVEVMNKFHPGKATFMEFPMTDHLLIGLKHPSEKWDMYNVPGMIPKICQEYGISKKLVDAFDSWMKDVMSKKG